MNEAQDLEFLKKWINRILDDTACPFISKACIFGHGGGDIRPHRIAWIKSLEVQRVLKILNEPAVLKDEDPYVEMLQFIERKSSIPGFLDAP